MATGDILSVTITDKTTAGLSNDGWYADIVIEGFVDGGTYAYGYGTNNDPTSAKVVFTVTSEGYTAAGSLSTVVRTVYGTRTMRKAYPNEANLYETEGGGNLTIRVALSDFIYNDDKNGGAGTSGTDVSVSIGAGWYTDDGTGGSSTASAAFSGTATNNSTLDYPIVHGRWDMVAGAMAADRVTANFNLAAMAYSRFGIACVRFDADGQGSANNANETVTTKTAEQYSASGLYREHYKTAALAISGFNDAELIDLRFRAYPIVGDADSILDTNNNTTATDEILGKNKATIVCDKNGDSTLYAVVDASSGVDATGVVSGTLATAEASPYLTIGGALEDGANTIYLLNGTHGLGNTKTLVTTNEWIRIMPHPTSASKASTFAQMDATRQYNCTRFSIEGCTVRKASTSSYMDGETNAQFIRFRNCTFDDNAIGRPSTGCNYRSYGVYFQNCDGDLGDLKWYLNAFSTARGAQSIEGCLVDKAGNATVQLIGSQVTYGLVDDVPSAGPGPYDRVNVMFNRFYNGNCTSPMIKLGHVRALTGLALIGNVLEAVTVPAGPAWQVAADSANWNVNNVLLWHNTIRGERANFGYNDSGSTAYDRTNWSQIGNLIEEWNNKDDTFTTGNGARTGCWPIGYNVGTYGCVHTSDSGAGSFRGEWDGLYTNWGGTPTFVDDASASGSTLGNGDYELTGTVGVNFLPAAYKMVSYDLFGTLRSSTPDAGAVESPATFTPHISMIL